ncbi:LysR family transcriptional regulator [Acidithiobacillus sp. M4-SHS-6]|uniref:LysR family transcriptional regulator n=1 Tax=Acidithiobacillus sp. M4-SHS-6 TaxID=3383024 RepID=UPI0039BE72E4
MHLTLRQIKVFEAVARHRSFTRAAAELYLTQPAVSMQIKQLEETTGLPLFEQLGKRVYLTEAGKEFARYSRAITQQLNEAAQVLDELKGLQRGRLQISVATTGAYIAPYLLSAFARSFPGIMVNMTVTNRQVLLEQLENNEVDMAIMGQPPEDVPLEAVPFLENLLVVAAPPGHPLVGKGTIPLKALENEPFIIREEGSGTRSAAERFFASAGVKINAIMEMSSHEAIKHAVRAGLGLGIVSTHTIRLELEGGYLAILDVESLPIRRHWYLVHRRGKRLAGAALAFNDYLLGQDVPRLLP